MSNTATRYERSQVPPPSSAEPPLPPPPKLRRRPALIAAAVVAICLGAILGGWAWTATTNTQEALAARADIERGAIIEADDLVRVRVNSDPALKPVGASSLDSVVGQRAAVDIAAGSLLTPSSYADSVVPAENLSVVGVALTSSQAPGMNLRTGDRVRVVATPAEGDRKSTRVPSFRDRKSTRLNSSH